MKKMKSLIFWVANYQVKLAHLAFNWIIINRMLQMLFFKTLRFRLATMKTIQMLIILRITLVNQVRDRIFKLIKRYRTSKQLLVNLLERKRTVASSGYNNIKWQRLLKRKEENNPKSEWIYKFMSETIILIN